MTRKMCSLKVSSPLTVYNSRKGHNFQRQSGVKLFSFFFSLDLLLEDEISASLRDLRRFLMRIPFILSLDFCHSGLGSVVQNLVFAFPLSSGAKIFHTKFLPQHVSESIFFVKL